MARRLQGFAVVASTLGVTLALTPVVPAAASLQVLTAVLAAALLPLYLVVSLVPVPVPPWPRPPTPPEPRPDPHPVDPRSPRGEL